MCEAIDPIHLLERIPFKVASIEHFLQGGSYEETLAQCVYDSVRADIERAVAAWKSERVKKQER
jgi:hypothetical protein